MTYPNGKILAYTYGTTGTITDAISRATTLTFDGTDAESYTYLGNGTIVQRANPAVTLTYLDPAYGTSGDAGDAYTPAPVPANTSNNASNIRLRRVS